MSTIPRVFAFLSRELKAGRSAVLVTVTDVTGASVRNPGAQLGVSETGEWAGSLSGGCIERAIVAEALDVLDKGEPRRLRYGAGSPVIDIRLPCGGRVDLLFSPLRDAAAIDGVLAALAARRTATLLIPATHGTVRIGPGEDTGWSQDEFCVRHAPPLRLVIFGHGATPEALVSLAGAMDVESHVLSPEPDIVARLSSSGIEATLLESRSRALLPAGDPWTAYVCLFHDHDWEGELLAAALAGPSLFVGAMGSRRTHAARLERMRDIGVDEALLSRIVAPIGLIPSSRDPETLALSILAQIVERYNTALSTEHLSKWGCIVPA